MAAWTRMFLADEVEKAVVIAPGFKKRFGTLAARPYNLEKPDQTVWWLFSRTRSGNGHWPAYHLGKYFFDRVSVRKAMRAGLHVEKGIAPEFAKGYQGGKGLHFGMKADWAWYQFVEDLRSGALTAVAGEMGRRSGLPVEVTVEPSFPLDQPQPNVHETFGYHRFLVTSGGGLRLVEERAGRNKLVGVGKVASLRELGDRFVRATTEECWTWINVFVSCAVPYAEHAEPEAPAPWSGTDFWEKILEPLAPWVD